MGIRRHLQHVKQNAIAAVTAVCGLAHTSHAQMQPPNVKSVAANSNLVHHGVCVCAAPPLPPNLGALVRVILCTSLLCQSSEGGLYVRGVSDIFSYLKEELGKRIMFIDGGVPVCRGDALGAPPPLPISSFVRRCSFVVWQCACVPRRRLASLPPPGGICAGLGSKPPMPPPPPPSSARRTHAPTMPSAGAFVRRDGHHDSG